MIGTCCVAVIAVVVTLLLIHCHKCCPASSQPERRPGFRKSKGGLFVPISILAGPSHEDDNKTFVLDDSNSQRMTGANDPRQERWCDIAGNYYSTKFIAAFSYERTDPDGPEVRLRVDETAPTFRGRIEGRRLKPNFVYQLKLRGVYGDIESFEAIGYTGRWRLPGGGTNFTDDQYRKFSEKEKVESYVYFDYFFTDADGNASREFELDTSMHILWNAKRQRKDAQVGHLVPVIVRADNPDFYARPKNTTSVELLWNEREWGRYESANQKTRLPPGKFQAELALTEESFHARDRDGGFWATVYTCPVSFTVTPPIANYSAGASPSRE